MRPSPSSSLPPPTLPPAGGPTVWTRPPERGFAATGGAHLDSKVHFSAPGPERCGPCGAWTRRLSRPVRGAGDPGGAWRVLGLPQGHQGLTLGPASAPKPDFDGHTQHLPLRQKASGRTEGEFLERGARAVSRRDSRALLVGRVGPSGILSHSAVPSRPPAAAERSRPDAPPAKWPRSQPAETQCSSSLCPPLLLLPVSPPPPAGHQLLPPRSLSHRCSAPSGGQAGLLQLPSGWRWLQGSRLLGDGQEGGSPPSRGAEPGFREG